MMDYRKTKTYWMKINDSIRTKTLWEAMVNKGSSLEDFVRFRSYTHARTQQSLPPVSWQ